MKINGRKLSIIERRKAKKVQLEIDLVEAVALVNFLVMGTDSKNNQGSEGEIARRNLIKKLLAFLAPEDDAVVEIARRAVLVGNVGGYFQEPYNMELNSQSFCVVEGDKEEKTEMPKQSWTEASVNRRQESLKAQKRYADQMRQAQASQSFVDPTSTVQDGLRDGLWTSVMNQYYKKDDK
jgi:hypothetical protein